MTNRSSFKNKCHFSDKPWGRKGLQFVSQLSSWTVKPVSLRYQRVRQHGIDTFDMTQKFATLQVNKSKLRMSMFINEIIGTDCIVLVGDRLRAISPRELLSMAQRKPP